MIIKCMPYTAHDILENPHPNLREDSPRGTKLFDSL